jgi:hypothetical protein
MFARAILSVTVIFGAGVLFAVLAPEKTHYAVNRVKSFEENMNLKLVVNVAPDECQKWETKGDRAMKGCAKCATYFPGRTDQCMSCGGICMKKSCEEKQGDECFESSHFQHCHSGCMKRDAETIAEYAKKMFAVAEKKVDTKECYFDAECHKLVDWDRVTKVKMGFFERAKALESPDDLRPLMEGVHDRLVRAGYPEDRAWYTVRTWAAAVAKKGSEEKKELPVDKKEDCYFDPECHKLVDWDLVTKVKMGFFSRAKELGSIGEVRPLAAGLRARLLRAGVPEDRVDYIVSKWVKAAVKGFERAQPAPAGMPEDVPEECAKYEPRGALAITGCAKCAEYYPGKTDECMTCGGVCKRKVCEESELDLGECVKTPPFAECHKACMAQDKATPEGRSEDNAAAEGRSNAKLLKLMRLKRGAAAAFAQIPNIF